MQVEDRTLYPAVCSYNRSTHSPANRTMAFTRNVLRQHLTIFSSEYYLILTATHLPTPEGYEAELT